MQEEKTKLAPRSHFQLLCVCASGRQGAQVPGTVVSAVGEAALSGCSLGPEAVSAPRAGIVGCVHIGLLQRAEAGFAVGAQVVLVQGLWEEDGTKEGVKGQVRKGDSQVKEIRGQ